MSRIGKNPVVIPDAVTMEVNGQDVKAKGPKGELSLRVNDHVLVTLEEVKEQDNEKTQKVVTLKPASNKKQAVALWPTMRTLVNNLVVGVNEGYSKKLEIRGVGYRAQLQGTTLVMQLGLSHEVRYQAPEGVQIQVENQTEITVSGIEKQKVGQVAADIRSYRTPEPYKGKGIRYADEYVMIKEGKKK